MRLEGHLFDGLHAEIVCGTSRREGCGEAARALNRVRVGVHAEYLIPLPEKIDQVAPRSAARIEQPHPRPDTTSEKLIEQVDVDLAELLLKIGHGFLPIIHSAEL